MHLLLIISIGYSKTDIKEVLFNDFTYHYINFNILFRRKGKILVCLTNEKVV